MEKATVKLGLVKDVVARCDENSLKIAGDRFGLIFPANAAQDS